MRYIFNKNKLENQVPYLHLKNKCKSRAKKPLISLIVFSIIICCCIFISFWGNTHPNKINLNNTNIPPNKNFWFGTDNLGRDIFRMIWYGGRISLFISIFATLISTTLGVIYGTISGIAPSWLDDLLMGFVNILLSIPSLLIIIFMQAFFGQNNLFSLAIIIGISFWMPLAKVIRTEVKQIWKLDYIVVARVMGGSFLHILRKHLFPNYFPTIFFIIINTMSGAIVTESILSFLGIGLPINTISWGGMLSLSEQALLTNYWWIILIPAFFLITTVMCLTNIAEYIRKKNTSEEHYI